MYSSDYALDERIYQYGDSTLRINRYVTHMRNAVEMTMGLDTTGVVIWPSTHFLIQDLLKRKDQFANKALLELGSGTGIAGLVLSSVAGRVVLSDGNIDTIESLKQNVERNQDMLKASVSIEHLRWGEDVPEELAHRFSFVVGAELMYKKESFLPLFQTARQLLASEDSARLILTYVNERQQHYIDQASSAATMFCTRKEVLPFDGSLADEWGVLDYGEEIILQEFKAAE